MKWEKGITYKELIAAVRTLELGDSATLEEIKEAYRSLARKYHPDADGPHTDPEIFIKISSAYRLLMRYASCFRIEFSEGAFLKRFPEERLRRRFSGDPLWGPGNPDEEDQA